MKTTTKLTYWENSNGQFTCSDHAGHYLLMSISTYPNSKKHDTPLGTWYAMPAHEVRYMTENVGGACETCVFGKGY